MKACTNKLRWESEWEAQIAAAKSEYKWRKPMKIYPCGNHWHVASLLKEDRNHGGKYDWCKACQTTIRKSNMRKHRNRCNGRKVLA